MHHGTKSVEETNALLLLPSEEDTVTVWRPEYKCHELWVWDPHLFVRDRQGGWQFVSKGTEAEMTALADSFV